MRIVLTAAALLLTAAAPPTRIVQAALPDQDGLLPDRGAVSADAVNANCLACHSAGMTTAQPRLSRVQWGETIAKMRSVYAAPIAPEDEAAILDWLVAPQAAPPS